MLLQQKLRLLIGFKGKCGNFGGVGMMIYANDLAMAISLHEKEIDRKIILFDKASSFETYLKLVLIKIFNI
jgi:hypothetical protein